MSNVLIGVIGVILFIGLALAGALILGSDFASASSASTAAAMMTQIRQTADAMNMSTLKTGQAQQSCTTLNHLVPRFLKTLPQSPIGASRTSFFYTIQMNTDTYPESATDMSTCVGRPTLVIGAIGVESDSLARGICQAIADEYSSGAILVGGGPSPQTGCTLYGGIYAAFQRI